jgi:membrane-bound metal-dependent hydrolase YbcI (DUF457 family)
MASNQAHHATGWPAGIVAAALVAQAGAGGPYAVWCFLALIAGISGGTAPDWLEVVWWSKRRRLWITHRTITHWGLAWIGLLIWSYDSLNAHPAFAVLFGFACGGVMHLLADWPNPLGVPWILGRHSLKWWTSGKCDFVVIALAWLAAFFVGDHVWFDNIHRLTILRYVRG